MTRLTARQVAERLSVARSTLYVLMAKHGFPRPVKIGGKREWIEAEVSAWELSQIEAR